MSCRASTKKSKEKIIEDILTHHPAVVSLKGKEKGENSVSNETDPHIQISKIITRG